jgi:hypothetical protein
MSLLEHTFNYINKNGNNITFSSDYKIFIHMLQYIYFGLSKYEDIKNYNSINYISYNFKTKYLVIECKECPIFENHLISSAANELLIEYIKNGIRTNDELTFFLRDNEIITINKN